MKKLLLTSLVLLFAAPGTALGQTGPIGIIRLIPLFPVEVDTQVLDPPPGQVGDPSAEQTTDDTYVLTNRGRIISDPVNTEDLNVNVTLVFPTDETLPNGERYKDFIRVVIGATEDDGLQTNRPWEIDEPGTVVVTVQHNTCFVVVHNPDNNGDGHCEQVLIGQSTINTADGGLPLEVEITINDGVINVTTGGQGGAGGDPITHVLPPGVNPDGNVIIYNRERVAGVDFVAEVSDLDITGVVGGGAGGNAPPGDL